MLKGTIGGSLLILTLGVWSAFAQTNFDGRSLAGIKKDYKAVGAVAQVKINKITPVAKDISQLYAVDSEIIETFKGAMKKGTALTFYFSAEEGYDAQSLAGREWVVFLDRQRPVPAGGKGWYELENSKLSASEKLSAQLRKLKAPGKKS